MPKEQLMLEGFENIPVIESNVSTEKELINPRFPLIDKLVAIYGDDSLLDEGLTWFDDGEDRFLFALDVRENYEKMLLAKTKDPDEEYGFTKDSALIIEARYTPSTDRLLEVNYYILDFSKINDVSKENDWISFFWVDELDKDRIDQLLVEKVKDESVLQERVKKWWALSPFEAKS